MLFLSEHFGRFGNNIYQLLNIILESEKQNDGINIDLLSNLNMILNINMIEKSVNKKFKNKIKKEIVSDHFMPKDLHLINKRTVDISRFFDIAKNYIHNNFKIDVSPISEKTCTIHLRAGDIFSKFCHNAYVQPPLAYYKKIIDENNNKYDQFIILTEPEPSQQEKIMRDAKMNPCVKELLEYSPKTKIVNGNMFQHYQILLKSQSIILSRSSFSDTSTFISPNIKNIYFWSYNHCLDDTTVFPDSINVKGYKLLKPYIEIGEWKHTQEQLNLMLTYKKSDIEELK